MSIRRKAREMALQCLYQIEMSGVTPEEALNHFCQNFEVNKKAALYAKSLISGVNSHRVEIDNLIDKYAVNWRISRIAAVDRNIIRVAVFELCYGGDVPATVAINEAIDIAKRFSTDDAASFINGILDAVRKNENVNKVNV